MRSIVAFAITIALALAGRAEAATPNHVVIVVRNLETARHRFEAAGFAVARSEPISKGFAHALVPFRDGSYLELISASVRTPDNAGIYDAQPYGDRPVGIGFEVSDIARERAQLLARRFRVEPVSSAPYWSTMSFSEPAGVLEPFFYIQYAHSGAAYFHRYYTKLLQQPNGASGFTGVDVAVEPGTHASAIFERAGLEGAVAIENGAGDPKIVAIRLRTANAAFSGRTVDVDGCKIIFSTAPPGPIRGTP
jgi:catechol 2,3-dioxygenase-like lactoylglutathione lyase family enzyme